MRQDALDQNGTEPQAQDRSKKCAEEARTSVHMRVDADAHVDIMRDAEDDEGHLGPDPRQCDELLDRVRNIRVVLLLQYARRLENVLGLDVVKPHLAY